MAILDTSRKPYIVDNDTSRFVGLDLPIRKGDDINGYFASTSTTLEAVRNNIRNLVNTTRGERLMQPGIGLNLRKYLFQQMSEDLIAAIENDILDVIDFWLPFVDVRDMRILTHDFDTNIPVNTINIEIIFNIKKDPNTLDSVEFSVADGSGQVDNITGAGF
tara:strand:+ start:201 stop:686 length:486 start_codon:yes stop_codon:yes gene_type:complete